MIFMSFVSFVLCAFGIIVLFGLTPGDISEDIRTLFSPRINLRQRALIVSGRKKKSALTAIVNRTRDAIEQTGKSGRFGLVCLISFFLIIGGPVLYFLTDHFFYIPIFTTLAVFLPFFVAENALETYSKRMSAELETALSVISSAYIRIGNIVEAVKVSIPNIRYPVDGVFKEFIVNTTSVSPDLSVCIKKMKNSIDNRVFQDWCEVLLACMDDSSNKDALLPIVSELTEIRLANSEMATMISECRKEYLGMALLTVGNVPLLYFLNKDWWDILINSAGGQIVLSVCGVALVLTAFFMMRFTKPLEIMKKGERK